MDDHIHTSCTICDYNYNEQDKRPLVLPCSHSFCKDCLEKVEAAGSRLCPVCRKPWGNTLLANFPSCYQLIPSDTTVEDVPSYSGQKRKRDLEENELDFEPCKVHNSDLSLWCETCQLPACRKCLSQSHKGCDFVLMEEKCDALKEKFNEKLCFLENELTKFTSSIADNNKKLTCIKTFIDKMASLHKELLKYREKMLAWQIKAQEVLLNHDAEEGSVGSSATICSVDNTQLRATAVDNLELQLPSKPSSLLLQIACSYENSPSPVVAKDFISALSRNDDEIEASSSSEANPASEVFCQDVRKLAATLKEGEDWVISGSSSAAAVSQVLQTTSIRPSSVKIASCHLPDEKLFELGRIFGHNKMYEVNLKESLPFYLCHEKLSLQSLAYTGSRLDVLLQQSSWSNLTHFWGHLDVEILKKLPISLKSLGLVIKDEKDIHVVNAICGVAFTKPFQLNNRDRLIWTNLAQLHLSVAKTFQPSMWTLRWEWQAYQNSVDYSPITLSVLPRMGISFYLHLPQLRSDRYGWMKDLMAVIDANIGRPIPLYLSGASLDPDSLLGALRDSRQPWEVHFPTSLPQVESRRLIADRYKAYHCSAAWDMKV